MHYLKTKTPRDKAYLRYVASFPCFGCGIEGYSQAAHPNAGKGLAIKASDFDAFPLCAPRFGLVGCHQSLDWSLDMTRDQRREMERTYTARMQALARADGWELQAA